MDVIVQIIQNTLDAIHTRRGSPEPTELSITQWRNPGEWWIDTNIGLIVHVKWYRGLGLAHSVYNKDEIMKSA